MGKPAEAAEILRLPPHSVEAERCLLGALLTTNNTYDRLNGVVREADFYRNDHRLIWRHVRRLLDANQPADAITVCESLERASELEAAGGLQYVASLQMEGVAGTNARRYAEIVRDKAQRRELIVLGEELTGLAYGPTPTEQMIEQAQARVMAITEQRQSGNPQQLHTYLTPAVEEIDRMYNRADMNAITGVASGLVDLDHHLDGWQPTDLIVVAGRPGMGKSVLGAQSALHAAVHVGPAVLFTMEMSGKQLVLRYLAALMGVNGHALRLGKLKDEAWSSLTGAVGKLHQVPLWLDESPALTVGQVAARCRSLARSAGPLSLVVVDYLQLMRGEGETRVQEIGSISRGLKGIAKDLQVPVVALSQLNRGLESRTDKRPQMSDLRESGDIEADADVILMLYRDEVYDKDSEAKGTAEVLIRKFRNGPPGMVRLTFLSEQTQFANYAGLEIFEKKRKHSRRNGMDDDERERAA